MPPKRTVVGARKLLDVVLGPGWPADM